MPSTTRTRTIDAPAGQLWEIVRDPHHLPRWWPRVNRVEGVEGQAFTEVMRSERGRIVRADFLLLACEESEMRLLWAQQIAGTPFATVLLSSETELRLSAVGAEATEVSITLHQTLPGFFSGPAPAPGAGAGGGGGVLNRSLSRLGSPMVRRAAARTLDEALEGLARIAG